MQAYKHAICGALTGVLFFTTSGCTDDGSTTAEPDAGAEADASSEHDAAGHDAGDPLTTGEDASEPGETPGPQVTLEDGALEGMMSGDGIREFRGIPYAKPPVGELRFMPPEPNEAWTDTRDATEFGNRCAQLESTTLQNAASEDEDCLFLNVWSPEDAEALPVMVWIHGGGNRNGSASEPLPFVNRDVYYSGTKLAEQGVIVVSLNYRLGVLGFLGTPQLHEGDGTSGNQGLWDQRLALQWVHDNIEKFGGDPSNVTIFGESAGSFDVCLHVASPESRDLFHKAISQSGGCTTQMLETAEAEATTQKLAEDLGCDAADILTCLRDASVQDLLDAAGTFGPHVDGRFIPEQPRSLYDANDIAQVPYMLGSNSDEGTLFIGGSIETQEDYDSLLMGSFSTSTEAVAAVYPPADYMDAMPNPFSAAAARAVGDARLVCTTYDSATRARDAGLDVYMYNFAIPAPMLGPSYLGAAHGAELTYVFGTSTLFQGDTLAASQLIQRYWTRFASTGDPNGDSDPQWDAFVADENVRMNLAVQSMPVEDFRRSECEFWQMAYQATFDAADDAAEDDAAEDTDADAP